MHELSVAQSLVELVEAAPGIEDAKSVKAVHLVVGALSCVSPRALEFCFELASRGSVLEGAQLRFRRQPVVIHCAPCAQDVELPGIQSFRCPQCGTLSRDVRQGRELEIASLEIELDDPQAATPDSAAEAPAEAEDAESHPERH